jgi:6-phosphofructokinase 1
LQQAEGRSKPAAKRGRALATIKNAFYAQSGGVTAVINASACGVIETARKHRDKIGTVYAGRNGIIGALTEDLIDTSKESDAAIAALRSTPAGAFGSCRYKLKSLEANQREYERLIEVFRAHDIGYFFYNGGGDSADTCFKVSQLSEKMGYPVQAIHVPKTVDNDLPITDCCPGFGSAAKYIAVSTLEASFDVRSMAKTSTRIFVIEVMGRHAGWIAAAGGLVEDHGIPVVILFPEVEFDQQKFLAKVDEKVKQYGYCTVVVSEGCHYPDGRFLAEQGVKDAFGHAQLGGAAPVVANMIKDALGHRFHWAVADYLQRAARHIASKTDVRQAYALGKAAVELAVKGKNSVMPTVVRVSDEPYKFRIGHAELKDVANVEKFMPLDFISKDGYGITEKCKRYLRPLIQGEDYPEYDGGLPVYVTLKNMPVAKRLPEFKI